MSFIRKLLGLSNKENEDDENSASVAELHPFDKVTKNVHPFKLDSTKKAKRIGSSVQAGAPLSAYANVMTETNIRIPTDLAESYDLSFSDISNELNGALARQHYNERMNSKPVLPKKKVEEKIQKIEKVENVEKVEQKEETKPEEHSEPPKETHEYSQESESEESSREIAETSSRAAYSSSSSSSSAYSRAPSKSASASDSESEESEEHHSPVQEQKPEVQQPVKKAGFRSTNFKTVAKVKEEEDVPAVADFSLGQIGDFSVGQVAKPDPPVIVSKPEVVAAKSKAVEESDESSEFDINAFKKSIIQDRAQKGHMHKAVIETDFSRRKPSSNGFSIPEHHESYNSNRGRGGNSRGARGGRGGRGGSTRGRGSYRGRGGSSYKSRNDDSSSE